MRKKEREREKMEKIIKIKIKIKNRIHSQIRYLRKCSVKCHTQHTVCDKIN